MSVLLHKDLDDFVALTLKKFKRDDWVDISLDLQEYYFANLISRGENRTGKKTAEDGGEQLSWRVQVRNIGGFKHSGLYAIDNTHQADIFKEAKVEWVKQSVFFTYDVDEPAFQSGKEKIIDILKGRRHAMYNDFYEGMELAMWQGPSGTSDAVPKGIPHWVVKPSSNGGFGFNGTNPSGFTDGAGGLSSTTYENWANGTFTYNSISEEDGLDSLFEACEKCKFKAPHDMKLIDSRTSRYAYYTTFPVFQTMGKLARQQNDNMKADLAMYRDKPLFKGVPFHWVAALTNTDSEAYDSSDPIYGIDWNQMEWVFHKDRQMIVHDPAVAAKQHTVREVFMDNWGQFRCWNRRRHFVGKKAA